MEVIEEDTHIPKPIEIHYMAKRWIPLVKEFFDNPDNQRKFEQWKKNRIKKEPLAVPGSSAND